MSRVLQHNTYSLTALLVATVSASSAGFLFGSDIAVMNGAITFLQSDFHLTSSLAGSVMAISFWGCALGSVFGGTLSDRFGRKPILCGSGALFSLSLLLAVTSYNVYQLLVARLIAGVAIGLSSLVAPLFISEISPSHLRGRLVTLNQLATVTGMLAGYVANYELTHIILGRWQWMFAFSGLPAFVLVSSFFWLSESPVWLSTREPNSNSITERVDSRGTVRFRSPSFRRPITLGIALAMIQQFTGVSVVLYYGTLLFQRQTSTGLSHALAANIGIGVVNLLFTVFGLLLIDRLGRRPLLLTATGGMGICLLGFSGALKFWQARIGLLVGFELGYVACFAFGLGTAVWVCLAEFLPSQIRGRAMSIATAILWISISLVTGTFLKLLDSYSLQTVFLSYSVVCGASFLFIFRYLPETRNRSLEEIESIWVKPSRFNSQ